MKLKDRVDAFERKIIVDALSRAKSINEAAKILGCLRTTLVMKLKKHRIKINRPELKVSRAAQVSSSSE